MGRKTKQTIGLAQRGGIVFQHQVEQLITEEMQELKNLLKTKANTQIHIGKRIVEGGTLYRISVAQVPFPPIFFTPSLKHVRGPKQCTNLMLETHVDTVQKKTKTTHIFKHMLSQA